MDSWHEVEKGLFIVDADMESSRFLARMVDVASKSGASLTVAHCLEQPSRWSSGQAKEVHDLLKREWQGQLDQLVTAHRDHGVSIDARLLIGDPAEEIRRVVVQGGFDFVAKEASDHDEPGRLSGAEIHLIRDLPCSIWIDRPPAGDHYRNVLVAVDCMNPHYRQLNQEMIAGTLRFCEVEDATMHVLHVWEFAGEAMLRGRRFAGAGKVDAMVEEERRHHAEAFDALLRPFESAGSRLKPHLVKGRPLKVVMELAARYQIDLLVMGAGEQGGLTGWLLGTRAEQVLKVVPCAVYAQRPKHPLPPPAFTARPLPTTPHLP